MGVIDARDDAPSAQSVRARFSGMLVQSGNLLEHLTNALNVRTAQALTPHSDGPDAEELLATAGLTERSAARPSQLSGGDADILSLPSPVGPENVDPWRIASESLR